VTNVLSLEQNSPQPTSLSNLLEIHEINFEENWRYRTLSKLATLFHVTNVTTVLNVTVASDRVSRSLPASQYLSQNKTIQWLIPVTTLVATVSNDFVRRLPGVHAPRGTNAKNCTCDRRLGVV